jgi:hypothetical protein
MKKILALLAVTVIAANLTGCCCQRLCPICPCNWFNRGAYCGTPAYAAPLVAQPCCPPTYGQAMVPQIMPQQTYAAAPLAAIAPNPGCCATWDPCRGTTITCPQQPCAPPCPQPCAQAAAPCCPPPCCPCPPVECCYPCDPCCCPCECSCDNGCSCGSSSYGGSGDCGCGGSSQGVMMGSPMTGGSTDPIPMAE